jgi:hypothetical protein
VTAPVIVAVGFFRVESFNPVEGDQLYVNGGVPVVTDGVNVRDEFLHTMVSLPASTTGIG